MGHGSTTRPDLIRRVVDAYDTVRPRLIEHDPRYPPAALLREMIKAGQPVAGPKVAVGRSTGDGKDTEGSAWIINVVDRPDPRPVWVLIWGGSADLAQAIVTVRKTRTPTDTDAFLSKLRVHSISDQDSTGPWLREQFPALHITLQKRAYRGMYRGGDRSFVSPRWVTTHIHGHGPLGDLYPNYNGGDIWSSTLGAVRGIKEGDTPSFLSLVPNGLGDLSRPEMGSWGGRFGGRTHLTDLVDTDLDTKDDPDPRMSSVYRWRSAFQADFQARLDWCINPFAGANHSPVVKIKGRTDRRARPGDTITLDAGETTDPDGHLLTYEWSVYPTVPGVSNAAIGGQNTKIAMLIVTPGMTGKTVPILLSVRDAGTPCLTRYGRVWVTVE